MSSTKNFCCQTFFFCSCILKDSFKGFGLKIFRLDKHEFIAHGNYRKTCNRSAPVFEVHPLIEVHAKIKFIGGTKAFFGTFKKSPDF